MREKFNRKRLIFRYDRKIPDYFSVAGASISYQAECSKNLFTIIMSLKT